MSEASEEFADEAQRRAVCEKQWDEGQAGATSRYPHVAQFVRDHPWAILPATLDAIVEVVRLRAGGHRLTDEEIRARIGAATPPTTRTAGAIRILPLYGVIAHRMNLMAEISGGTSTERFAAAFREAMKDPDVGAVVLDVDSPGGSVFGVQELADTIFAARGAKPIVAIANPLAASAAYWIASQADEVIVTPSGEAGSIGILAIHEDLSQMAARAGLKVTYISAGPYKAEGQPFEPLTDDARAAIQARVDEYYATFVDAVARGRRTTPAKVRKGFGEGRMVSAAAALSLGMADRVETQEEALGRLTRQLATGGPLRAGRSAMSTESKSDGTAAQPKEGELVISAAQLEAMNAKIARLEALEKRDQEAKRLEAEVAKLVEDRRLEKIDAKVKTLKIPAFRAFARAFYDLASQTDDAPRWAIGSDPKKLLSAEQVVDTWLAQMNRSATLLTQTLSVQSKPADVDEPEAAQARVDYRVKKYLAQHPETGYRKALQVVLDADPELKQAYAAS